MLVATTPEEDREGDVRVTTPEGDREGGVLVATTPELESRRLHGGGGHSVYLQKTGHNVFPCCLRHLAYCGSAAAAATQLSSGSEPRRKTLRILALGGAVANPTSPGVAWVLIHPGVVLVCPRTPGCRGYLSGKKSFPTERRSCDCS